MSNSTRVVANDDLEETGLATAPDAFVGLEETEGGDSGYVRMPKVSNYSSYAKEPRVSRLKAANVKLGQFYLESQAFGIITRDPFRIFATPCRFACYIAADNKGKITEARLRVKGGWQPDKNNPADKKWKEHTLALVLVPLTDEAIVAAFLETTGALERLWNPIKDTTASAGNSAVWAALSPTHAKAAAAIRPWGRFVASIDCYEEPGKKDPSSKTVIGRSQILPTPEALVPAFNDYVTSEDATTAVSIFLKRQQKLIDMANGVYVQRGGAE